MSGLIGRHFGRYQILELIGQGGMAAAYKARDARLERDVALKVIRAESFPPEQFEIILKRFEREAKSLGGLSHPNIVGVIDYGEQEGLPYLVMEYLSGGTLKDLLGRPIPWRSAVRMLIPIARALEYTHEHGIINRDIKPSNILLTEKGLPMLTDFGLVKLFESKNLTSLTASGAGIGTPDYMAPEQWTGEATALSDMYALGVVFYEMITGRRPYVSDTPAGILLKQVSEPLPLPTKYVPDLPQSVESVMLKALARKPEDRYPDMRAFANDLQDLLDGREVNATTVKIKVLRRMAGVVETPQSGQTPPSHHPLVGAAQPALSNPASQPVLQKRKISPLLVGMGVFGIILACGGCLFLASRLVSLAATPPAGKETPLSIAAATLSIEETATATLAPTEPPAAPSMLEEIINKNAPMRLVPAGEFIMGSVEGKTDARPAASIFVNVFYIDKYEVTNEMYSICAADGGCRQPMLPGSSKGTPYYSDPKFANYPVIYVTWNMARKYCEWRGARLPTEAEWEKAGRGMEDQRAYPWGDSFNCAYANHYGCVGDTAAVNQYDKGQSPYGVYGMSGNVWEWTSSLYSFYPYNAEDGREDPDSSGMRVARGGSWNLFGSPGGSIRVDTRLKLDPSYYGAYVGIRCALTP